MLGSLKKFFHPEKGQVVVFTVLLLPLILGVVVFVIEMGNIYVHYSELQHVADTAALTGTAANARKVVEQNVNNLSGKRKNGKVADTESEEPNQNFLVKIYAGTPTDSTTPPANGFYVKLTKAIPMIFLKVFGDTRTVEVYSVSYSNSDGAPNELTYFRADPTDSEKFTWKFITP